MPISNLLEPILEGNNTGLGDGAILSVFAILLVFAILALIILITYGISILINKYAKTEEKKEESEQENNNQTKEVNITDDDMMTAVLTASIDYRTQTKKDIKVISVKEIK